MFSVSGRISGDLWHCAGNLPDGGSSVRTVKLWNSLSSAFCKKSPIKDVGDGILRLPFRKRRIRPLYARQEQSLRLKRREKS